MSANAESLRQTVAAAVKKTWNHFRDAAPDPVERPPLDKEAEGLVVRTPPPYQPPPPPAQP